MKKMRNSPNFLFLTSLIGVERQARISQQSGLGRWPRPLFARLRSPLPSGIRLKSETLIVPASIFNNDPLPVSSYSHGLAQNLVVVGSRASGRILDSIGGYSFSFIAKASFSQRLGRRPDPDLHHLDS